MVRICAARAYFWFSVVRSFVHFFFAEFCPIVCIQNQNWYNEIKVAVAIFATGSAYSKSSTCTHRPQCCLHHYITLNLWSHYNHVVLTECCFALGYSTINCLSCYLFKMLFPAFTVYSPVKTTHPVFYLQ
jgi:hypothetical protein